MYRELIENVNPGKDIYSKELFLVCELTEAIAIKIGDDKIFVSEFVIAKIMDYIPTIAGHPEVTKDFLLNLPKLLNSPTEILKDTKEDSKVFIICGKPKYRVVLEIKRKNYRTEINTIHKIRESTLRKLKSKTIIL